MSEETEEKVEETQAVQETISKRKRAYSEKIMKFFQDKFNIGFVLILFFAFVVRMYFYYLTKTQPLWWDEAEYMMMAKSVWYDIPTTGVFYAREPIIPIIWALFVKASNPEAAVRLFQNLVSLATVALTYLWGKLVFNKRIALYATFMMSVFWVFLFFTERLLLYIWAPFLYLLSLWLFTKGYVKKQGNLYLYLAALVMGVGISMYFSISFVLIILVIYLLITEHLSFLKKKEIWIAAIIGFVFALSFMLHSYIKVGSFLPRLKSVAIAIEEQTGPGLSGIFGYVKMFPLLFQYMFLALFVIGIAFIFLNFVLGYDLFRKNENLKSQLLAFLVFLVPLAIYTIEGIQVAGEQGLFYDAFIIPIFPAAFLIAGFGLDKIYLKLKTHSKYIALIAVIVLLLFGAQAQLKQADLAIKNKAPSFEQLKDAGLWIKDNSEPGDVIFSTSQPQVTYYSERETILHEKDEENKFLKDVKELKPKFIIASVFERSPDWYYEYIEENNETVQPVKAYFADPDQTQPILIVYEFI